MELSCEGACRIIVGFYSMQILHKTRIMLHTKLLCRFIKLIITEQVRSSCAMSENGSISQKIVHSVKVSYQK